MESSRGSKSPTFQQLYGTPKRNGFSTPRRGTPSQSGASPRTSSRGRGSKSPAMHGNLTARALNAVPVFSAEAAVRRVTLVSDRIAWTAECDGSIRVRSVPKGNELRSLEGRLGAFCTCLLFIEARAKVWAAFNDGFIRIFDVNTFAVESEFMQHDGAVECMVELEGNVYTGGRDWKIYQWKTNKTNYERQFFGHSNTVRCLCSYPAKTGAVLFSGSDDCTIRAWDPYSPPPQGKGNTACIHSFVGHSRGVLALRLVEVSNQLWSAGEDTTIRVWSLHTLECISILHGHSAPISCLMLVEHRIWSGDKHGQIFVWDIKTLAPVQEISNTLAKHQSVLDMCKMVPTMVWKVWTTGSAGQIHCWNAESTPVQLEGEMYKLPMHRAHDGGESLLEALKSENELLQSEVATLKKQLACEQRTEKPDASNVAQVRKVPTESRNTWPDRPRTEEGFDDDRPRSLDKSESQDILSVTDFPNFDASRNTMKLPQQPSSVLPVDESGGSAAMVISHYTCRFSGAVWGEVVSEKMKELRAAFHREAMAALGEKAQELVGLTMVAGTSGRGLVAEVSIAHSSAHPASELDSRLQAHPFVSVLEMYSNTVTQMYVRLKEKREEDERRRAASQDAELRRSMDETRMNDIIGTQKREISNLKDRLYSMERSNKALHDALHRTGETQVKPSQVRVENGNLQSHLSTSGRTAVGQLQQLIGEKEIEVMAKDERINHLNERVKTLKHACKCLQNEVHRLQERMEVLHCDNKALHDALLRTGETQVKPSQVRVENGNLQSDLSTSGRAGTPQSWWTEGDKDERMRQLQKKVKALQAQQKILDVLLDAGVAACSRGLGRQHSQPNSGMMSETGENDPIAQENIALSYSLATLDAAVMRLDASLRNAIQYLTEAQEDRLQVYHQLVQVINGQAPKQRLLA